MKKDIIKLNENNICISANCNYTNEDKVIEYQFNSEEERKKFFNNIQFYKHENGKIVELSAEEKEKLYPPAEPQPTEQDLINADIYMQLATLQLGSNGISLMSVTSPRYDVLKKYYDMGIYTKGNMQIFLECGWITEVEYKEIIQEK